MKADVTLAHANADIARVLEIYFDTFRVNTAFAWPSARRRAKYARWSCGAA